MEPIPTAEPTKPFRVQARLRSFTYAFRGIRFTVLSQHNAWIHAAATVVVVLAGVHFRISRSEWCLVILASAAVWIAEALNTAVEAIADATHREFHPLIGRAKDIAAGAVLIAAIAALGVGILVFGPYLRSSSS